ncbi:hypothetical protein EYR41_002318 [Orbilia oligospora]|uniref:Uncharacterized protein n=1 Tax=Orbilia oligospora TaxID=2813651 RepID=A0A8H2HD08_ORBOL|nr:hypothetical protein EYR41_002318 [Orbilia oligospora]
MASTPNSIKPLAQEHCALHVPEILGEILKTLPGLKTYTSTGLLASDLRIVGENATIENPVPQLTEVAKECLRLFCKKAASIIKGHPYWTVKETLSRRRLKRLEKSYRKFTRGLGGIELFKPPPVGRRADFCVFTPQYPCPSHKDVKQKKHIGRFSPNFWRRATGGGLWGEFLLALYATTICDNLMDVFVGLSVNVEFSYSISTRVGGSAGYRSGYIRCDGAVPAGHAFRQNGFR